MDDRQYTALKARIRQLTRVDLDYYKDAQMRRRLDNYIKARGQTVEGFARMLGQQPREVEGLKDFLTINVTEFFRDPEQFDTLRRKVIPELIARKPRLAVWSAGCSKGAEAYTLSMILSEAAPSGGFSVLATDIDERMLAIARKGGPYTEADLRALPKAFGPKYFTKSPEGHYVKEEARKGVTFRRHNLLADPYKRGFDLILCRNVVIYFTEEAKAHITRGFSQALQPDGFLFIGATEALLKARSLGLEQLSTCFYQRSGDVPRALAA